MAPYLREGPSVLRFLGLCCWEENRQTIGLALLPAAPTAAAPLPALAEPTRRAEVPWVGLGVTQAGGTGHIPEHWTGMPASRAVGTCHETGAVTCCAMPDTEQTPQTAIGRGLSGVGGRDGQAARTYHSQ